uniref:KaiB domain-containing protein n=1 Tax=Desulfovibrio sp. U5L TaxID=596152 RepID=I2PWF5_9BACT
MTTRLTLYLSGTEPESRRMTAALRAWCERELGGDYRLDVLDISQWPKRAENPPVLATPALVLESSSRITVGNLSDIPKTMAALGLASKRE